jgi:hypothetical protein
MTSIKQAAAGDTERIPGNLAALLVAVGVLVPKGTLGAGVGAPVGAPVVGAALALLASKERKKLTGANMLGCENEL